MYAQQENYFELCIKKKKFSVKNTVNIFEAELLWIN